MCDLPSTVAEKSPLYEAITTVLSCSLANDNQVQKSAEERKKNLEVIDEYPEVLCGVIGSTQEAVAERHLAAVFLKNYLEELFLEKRTNQVLFATNMGKRIAFQLMEYLNDNSLRIREMVAVNIAYILGLGFWDVLTIDLNDMVQSNDPDVVHNAVFVLSKAIDSQFFKNEGYRVDEHWFNVLLDVFKNKQIRGRTRLLSVHPMFIMMKHVKPHPNYVSECWTKLSDEFEKALHEPHSPTSDFQFKCEILKCLNESIDVFRGCCNIFIPPSLPAVGNLLTISCEQYKKIIRGTEKPPKDPCEEYDNDPSNFFEFISYILDFICSLVDMNYFDVLIEDLDNLLYCILVFMACHTNMEKYLFVNLYDRDHHFIIRDLCSQMLTHILHVIEQRRRNGNTIFFKSMHNAFQRLTNEAEACSSHGDIYKIFYISRITESMIYGLGLVKEKYTATDPEFVFPLDFYLQLWTDMIPSCQAMLQGRILWFGGVCSSELSPELLTNHLKTILHNLNSDADDKYVLVPSAEALCIYLKMYEKSAPEKKFVIANAAKDIMAHLINVMRKTNNFPIRHSLNALGYFIKSHKEVAASNLDPIEDILVKTILTHFADAFVMREVNFIVAKLAQNRSFKVLLHDKFLTFLLHSVHHLEPKEMKHDVDKPLDILNTISLYAPTVDDYFILQTFTGAATRLNTNTDREIELDESAANILTTLIVKYSNRLQFLQTMPKGEPVLEGFPALIQKLLEPENIIPGPVFGKLVCALICALPDLMQPHFETILRNVVTGSCKNYKTVRATWSIFAFICMIRTVDTLSYLSGLPGPNGGSALNFIMKMWKIDFISELETIERKMITLSITQILQNCLKNESDYAKMEEVCISFDQKPNEESPTGDVFTGIEYLYYLLVQFLLFEDKLQKK